MSKKTIKVSELPTFDPARYLRDDKDIAAYLTQVIEDGDFGELAQALGVAARARGMTQIAGIGRESRYKALRAGASPRFDTIAKVCKALGVRLVVQAKHPA